MWGLIQNVTIIMLSDSPQCTFDHIVFPNEFSGKPIKNCTILICRFVRAKASFQQIDTFTQMLAFPNGVFISELHSCGIPHLTLSYELVINALN